jgi:hypothetical protein
LTVLANKSPDRESNYRIMDYDKFMSLQHYSMELARILQRLAIVRTVLREQGNLKYARFLKFPDMIAGLSQKKWS